MRKSSTKAMLTMVLMSVFILCMGMTVCAAGGKTAPTQEILNASWSSGMIQVEDKIVQLPIRLSQLVQMGFTYEPVDGKNYLVRQKYNEIVSIYYKGVLVSGCEITNDTELPFATVEQIDPLVTSIHIVGPKNLDIYFPGGIKIGDHFLTLEQKLGTPRKIDYDMTHRYGTDITGYKAADTVVKLGVEFGVDMKTQVIKAMYIAKETDITTLDQMTPIALQNIKNTQSDAVHNVAFLFTPAHLEKQDVLSSAKSIVQLGTELYGMELQCGFEMAKYYGGGLGTPIYEQTDANGITHQVFFYGDDYDIVCIKDGYVLSGKLIIKNLATQSTDNIDPLFRETAIQIASSMVF